MITVTLEGSLGERIDREWKLNVRTAGEAIKAIHANTGNFLKDIIKKSAQYVLVIDGKEWYDQVALYVRVKKSIKLIPLLMGAAIVIPAIIGIIEAVAGYIAWYSLYVEFYLGVSAFWGTVIVLVGAALVMYGVYSLLVYLLTPDEEDPRFAGTSSFLFAGAQNTEGQGNPVPVGYGRLLVGSKVLSNCNTNVDKSKWEEEEQASDQLSEAQAARKATEGAIISALWGVPQDKLADLEG